jgi:hypothetical protein
MGDTHTQKPVTVEVKRPTTKKGGKQKVLFIPADSRREGSDIVNDKRNENGRVDSSQRLHDDETCALSFSLCSSLLKTMRLPTSEKK